MYDRWRLGTNIVQIWVACNTSAKQALLLKTSINPEGIDYTNSAALPMDYQTSFGSFVNITTISGQWFAILDQLLTVIAPSGYTSIFLPSVIGNISSIRMTYFGTTFQSLLISC
jgi:hypothetical protein